MSLRTDRRRFLQTGLAAAAVWPVLGTVRAATFTADPFALGVASGCPRPNSVVLWTRLIFPDTEPDPFTNPFAPIEKPQHPPLDVAWEIAHDEAFARPVLSGIDRAVPEFAHSVHVEATGLEPDRWYFYRFRCGDAVSPVGRTRTAPASDAENGRFSFAFASCQQFEQGWYTAYRDMAQRDLDLVVHLGDYIYEVSYGGQHVRSHQSGTPTLLYEYRDRHALYKSDPDLQRAHAAFPWLVLWDDHEVVNDYGGSVSPTDPYAPAFLRRRAAAYQAWYEHMPVPPIAATNFDEYRVYGHFGFGNLLDLTLLDTRQYRAPGPGEERAGSETTMLGTAQERWFDTTMAASQARWSVIGQPTLIAERDLEPGPGTRYAMDAWDGYRDGRERLLNTIQREAIRNPVVIGGDLHAFYAADLHEAAGTAEGPIIASEFVTGSITSNPPDQRAVDSIIAENPHLKFGNSSTHGYSIMTVERDRTQVDLVGISDRKDPAATAAVFQKFAVLDGMPGVNRL
ncbi:alkaline phosphatase D family protein [Pelagibacterium sp. H642]|uniref:alkaline phosphatase D family protein n=1 Tax=Pelagibacterium sp. H642 TaxID=1881069 RepID=UPI0028154031|nr:alkaline phosphatase D family protein [Pelagibacterium sp. H642]WMT92113.1 alkaline phosphatase D family protein [Pelagibacterium sp. H642]